LGYVVVSVTAATGTRDGASALPTDADACRAQLERILHSADFVATNRDRRFTTYVVGESLAGRADRIKACSIATRVFGRDASFDPQSDPIVRVEAGHLRRALERYHLGAGREDPVEVTIPKGGYLPFFVGRAMPAPAETMPAPAVAPRTPAARRLQVCGGAVTMALLVLVAAVSAGWSWRSRPPSQPDIPQLLVQPFDDLARTDASAVIARGLKQEVVGQTTKFRDIVVVAGRGGGETNPATLQGPRPRYGFGGSVDLDANAVRLKSPPDDGGVWTAKKAAAVMAVELGRVRVAEQRGWEALRAIGYALQRPRPRHARAATPEEQAAFKKTLPKWSPRKRRAIPARQSRPSPPTSTCVDRARSRATSG
jgi:transposase